MKFDEGYDVVHVDEKWFNEDKDDRAYLLLDGEEPPPRDRKSKRFIPKMMFLAAVARPRFDESTGTMFDGKIGMWPLTETYVAMRASVNRKKGTLCTRNVADDENLDEDTLNMQALDDALDDIAVVDE
ncbi:hypothetical protein PI126_g17609 [Phytophthora idaei]|nr:hypothetical protein PI126_g17609 [Phytophthora idaei]